MNNALDHQVFQSGQPEPQASGLPPPGAEVIATVQFAWKPPEEIRGRYIPKGRPEVINVHTADGGRLRATCAGFIAADEHRGLLVIDPKAIACWRPA